MEGDFFGVRVYAWIHVLPIGIHVGISTWNFFLVQVPRMCVNTVEIFA